LQFAIAGRRVYGTLIVDPALRVKRRDKALPQGRAAGK
jgi:hypothetical protein